MDEVGKALRSARAAQVGRIWGSFSNAKTIIDNESIQKGEDVEEMEKSDIMEAMDSQRSDLKMPKTGKEIKEQVNNILLPSLLSDLAVKEAEAIEKLKECGTAPTHDADTCCYTGGIRIDCGYKMYYWDETCFPENGNQIAPSLSPSEAETNRLSVPENKVQAECRRCYNDIVRAICNIKVDIKACEILKDLKDSTEYGLTPRQVLALRFS